MKALERALGRGELACGARVLFHRHAQGAGGRFERGFGDVVAVKAVDFIDMKGDAAVRGQGLKKLAHKVKPFGWHMEFLAHVDEFPDLDNMLGDFPVDTVYGHLGYMKTDKGIAHPGFQALLRLMKAGKEAIVGDQMLGGSFGGAFFSDCPGENYFHNDPEANRANIRKLLALGVETFYLGHGGPVAAADVAKEFGEP